MFDSLSRLRDSRPFLFDAIIIKAHLGACVLKIPEFPAIASCFQDCSWFTVLVFARGPKTLADRSRQPSGGVGNWKKCWHLKVT